MGWFSKVREFHCFPEDKNYDTILLTRLFHHILKQSQNFKHVQWTRQAMKRTPRADILSLSPADTCGWIWLCREAAPCRCRAPSLPSGHSGPAASSRCDNQQCLHELPDAPWGGTELAPVATAGVDWDPYHSSLPPPPLSVAVVMGFFLIYLGSSRSTFKVAGAPDCSHHAVIAILPQSETENASWFASHWVCRDS